jgi:hypothetical protein
LAISYRNKQCPQNITYTSILVAFVGLVYLSLFIATTSPATMAFLTPSTGESSKVWNILQHRSSNVLRSHTNGKPNGSDVLFGSFEGAILCAIPQSMVLYYHTTPFPVGIGTKDAHCGVWAAVSSRPIRIEGPTSIVVVQRFSL